MTTVGELLLFIFSDLVKGDLGDTLFPLPVSQDVKPRVTVNVP